MRIRQWERFYSLLFILTLYQLLLFARFYGISIDSTENSIFEAFFRTRNILLRVG